MTDRYLQVRAAICKAFELLLKEPSKVLKEWC